MTLTNRTWNDLSFKSPSFPPLSNSYIAESYKIMMYSAMFMFVSKELCTEHEYVRW